MDFWKKIHLHTKHGGPPSLASLGPRTKPHTYQPRLSQGWGTMGFDP
jgi:hypothetical protein